MPTTDIADRYTCINVLYADQFKLRCFREARDELGRLLTEIVHGACHHLLSDCERRMDPVDLETVAYGNACEAFAVGLRAVCRRPRLATDDRPPPKCDFPECLVAVEVPPQLSQRHMAVMALWLRWDPFTDRMAAFDVPAPDARDLWRYSADEWNERLRVGRTLEEKLVAFGAADRSRYPDDLKAYADGPQEARDNGGEDAPEGSERGAAESLEKTPSEETENRRRLERAPADSLKYPEKPNELNPRRYAPTPASGWNLRALGLKGPSGRLAF